jgi:two-component system chemotaxis response regulator CheY
MKIIIVEDEPISRRILENFLREWGYEVISTTDGMEAWEIIRSPDAPSLVISDWMMPKMDGVELCEKIRGMEKAQYTYFILLTTKAEKRDIIKGLESGADDFIVKPFDREELKYRVKIGERIINLEQRIMQLANTDYLTGVLNRRAFMERMEGEINRSIRNKKEISIILMDIDHFKKVNDKFGHQVGDLVLQRFTEHILMASRSYDFVGRYGGEEFIVGLPETNMEQSLLIAERMRQNIEEMQLTFPDNPQVAIRITASFGITSCVIESFEKIDSVIKLADDALYRAKTEGRNRVCRSL